MGCRSLYMLFSALRRVGRCRYYWTLYFASPQNQNQKLHWGLSVDNSETLLSILLYPHLIQGERWEKRLWDNELPPSFPYIMAKGVLTDTTGFSLEKDLYRSISCCSRIGRFESQVILPRAEEPKGNYVHTSYKLPSSQLFQLHSIAAPEHFYSLKCWEQNSLQPCINFLLLQQSTTNLAFKQYAFVILQFCMSEVWHESCHTKIKVSVGLNSFLEVPGEDLFPSSFGMLLEFSSLKDVGQSPYPFPCCLSVKGCPQLLEFTHIPWLVSLSSSFKASNITALWPLFHHPMMTEGSLLLRTHVITLGPLW